MTAAGRIPPPSPFWLAVDSTRAVNEFGAMVMSWPVLQLAPRGDGHPVIVLPGFLSNDLATLPLRRFLRSRGHGARGWQLGQNLGRGIDPVTGIPSDSRLLARVRRLHRETGRKVSLVGWSLGGLYAREIARIVPEAIRTVITLGSPFNGDHRANHVWRIFEFISGHKVDQIDPELDRRLRYSPPVPTTAIYSRSDGIVAWQCCVEGHGCGDCENIELECSHHGFGFHPLALWAIADRLAQPEGEWMPFDTSGVRRFLYRNWLA